MLFIWRSDFRVEQGMSVEKQDRLQHIFELIEANVNEVEELRIFTLQMVNLLMAITHELGLNDTQHPKSSAALKELLRTNDQIMQAVLMRQDRMKSLLLTLEKTGLKTGGVPSVERTNLPSVENILSGQL